MAQHAEPHGEAPELVMRQKQEQGEDMNHSHYWGSQGEKQSRAR